MILVTGGAGFIGSNFVLRWLREPGEPVVNVDKLTYAGNLSNLAALVGDPRHHFVHADIADQERMQAVFAEYRPRAVVHLAAESHVDRSLHGPEEFIQTNVVGTLRLLESARAFWDRLPAAERAAFRFLHVSTDEVYGSLGPTEPAFTERSPYAPSSPYSASKAGSDHLVRAYHRSYGLPVLVTHCSNNYGPFQFPEKLIPLMIHNALEGRPLPIYGDGANVRDWLYVDDHCRALGAVLEGGRPGETYDVGGGSERSNLELVQALCAILDERLPEAAHRPHAGLITFVADRPGHDRRYAIDAAKLTGELGWRPAVELSSGLRRTVDWYLANRAWTEEVTSGAYRRWVDLNYRSRRA